MLFLIGWTILILALIVVAAGFALALLAVPVAAAASLIGRLSAIQRLKAAMQGRRDRRTARSLQRELEGHLAKYPNVFFKVAPEIRRHWPKSSPAYRRSRDWTERVARKAVLSE